MSITRAEKTRNFTVMSNHHLKDKGLSLKAKGLLSLILSLPDEWDYSITGLASICKEGRDAIARAIKELEDAGYLERCARRTAQGTFDGWDYNVFEIPQRVFNDAYEIVSQSSSSEPEIEPLPPDDFPCFDPPSTENPSMEKTAQLSTNELRTKKLNTNPIKYGGTEGARRNWGDLSGCKSTTSNQLPLGNNTTHEKALHFLLPADLIKPNQPAHLELPRLRNVEPECYQETIPRYGKHKNVVLSDKDIRALQAEFPKDWQARIERLSTYLFTSGRKYKSNLNVIRAWAREDARRTQNARLNARPIPDYSYDEGEVL
jgi:hypothetical protein